MVEGRALRVAFFGTPVFALPTLDALLRSRHEVVGIVTQPDRPRGRGQKPMDSPVKARARAAGVALFQPDRLVDPSFVRGLDELRLDLGVVAAYGKLLTDELLRLPRLGMVNVHASLLPRYRGAAPVHRAIIAGESVTGVTIMRVVKALDAGPMLASLTRAIGPEETSEEVERDLALLGAGLLVETLEAIAVGKAVETAQDDKAATYASRLTKADGAIDWSAPATRIHDLIRGLQPWPHAYTFLKEHRLILLASTVLHEEPAADPGTVLEARGDRLAVAASDGVVLVSKLQAEGKRPMTARDFLAGHPIAAGGRLTSRP